MSRLSESCEKFSTKHPYSGRFDKWLAEQEADGQGDTAIDCEVAFILAVRDNISPSEANERVEEMREMVADGENPEDVLEDEAGLEPDYIFDLLGEA